VTNKNLTTEHTEKRRAKKQKHFYSFAPRAKESNIVNFPLGKFT